MSFIYAEKYREDDSDRESIRILCDTKVTPGRFTSAHFSEAEADLVKKYGIVKSTICCPELCVSFAGNNTLYASELFRQLNDMGSFETEDVSSYALRIHQEAPSQDDIEFIVAYFLNGQIHIDCVKNGKLERDCLFAHVGSEEAFHDFQRVRLSSSGDPAKQTSLAFADVVAGCIDDTVGGRAIGVSYDYEINSFVYQWRRAFHTEKSQTVALGEPIVFYSSASDGGYSYEVVHMDIENVLFIIDQMEPEILYSRRFRVDSRDVDNPHLFGMMLPMLAKPNEKGELIRCQ